MYDFSAFDDFRVCAWLSEGLMTKADNLLKTVTASVKSAGVVVATAVTLATSPMAVAKVGPDTSQTLVVTSAKMSSAFFDQGLNKLAVDNEKILRSLGTGDEGFHTSTLESADSALARINERGINFSQEWLKRMQSI